MENAHRAGNLQASGQSLPLKTGGETKSADLLEAQTDLTYRKSSE